MESLLLSGLLLLAVYVLWDMGFALEVRVPSWMERADGLLLFSIPWQPVFAVSAGLAGYRALQAIGRDRFAFWLMALATTVPHALPAWSHNRIEWHVLLEFQRGLVDERSVYGDMTLFVVCLVGLVALHRILGMKGLERQMQQRGVDPQEKRRVMRYEGLLLIGLIAVGLLVAALMAFLAAALASYDGLLDGSSPTIVTVGGGAALLLALTLLLWFRGLQGFPDAAGPMGGDRSAGSRREPGANQ
ncbi:MAG: hypothetical protein OXE50_11455 [Chloroflexi bacterium]|nr:hypothetical protein [Chloroflexota bacterium]